MILACPTTRANLSVAYASSVIASAGSAPYTYAVHAGTLPTGLALNVSTGAITGTPTVVGAYPFTIRVTDNAAATLDHTCQITVGDLQWKLERIDAKLTGGQGG